MRRLSALATLALLAATIPAVAQPVYSNVTNSTNNHVLNGGAATGNGSTVMIADDINAGLSSAGLPISGVQFSVFNADTATFRAAFNLQFFADDGAGNGPGTFLGSARLVPAGANRIALGNTTFGGTLSTPFTVPSDGRFWAGISFDNSVTLAPATIAQLNNLGMSTFDPPTVGSSTDLYFVSSATGTFPGGNPAGTLGNLGGNPVANFGWSFTPVPEPMSVTTFLVAGGLLAYRRVRRAPTA
jgi:hypothetical protein